MLERTLQGTIKFFFRKEGLPQPLHQNDACRSFIKPSALKACVPEQARSEQKKNKKL